ncbi:hypothetical protein [Streptomyces caeruleatus]|uniref:Uncharacterized protein n=1 Tax=Streptomyces caeruleatus TaxID=661399 RepID=A0A117RRL1_9ACTN|nr:hypothetical protein [Streptomyces caeruleatus]KUO05419.1 hypothetical protein AQJ67_08660 [Streptomyces caeruleatus]
MSDADGAPVPDFLDRLIARHTPAAAGNRPGVVRVRPRLPGPFERVEAVRSTAPDPDDGTDLLWPATTPSAVRQGEATRPATPPARSHTERERTVVRTERAPADPAPRPLPETPLLRPVAPLAAEPRPTPDAVQRASGRGRPERGAAQTAAAVPIPPGTDAAPAAVSAALRPSAADTAAARDAVRQAGARRPSRTPEQVVQVQIGRLEVTAGPSPSGGPRKRTPATERPGATLSLADYLARGRE